MQGLQQNITIILIILRKRGIHHNSSYIHYILVIDIYNNLNIAQSGADLILLNSSFETY